MCDNSDIKGLPDRNEARSKLLKEINEMIEIDEEGNIISLNGPIDIVADLIRRYIRDFMPDEKLKEILWDEPGLSDANDEQAFLAKKTRILLGLMDGSN